MNSSHMCLQLGKFTTLGAAKGKIAKPIAIKRLTTQQMTAYHAKLWGILRQHPRFSRGANQYMWAEILGIPYPALEKLLSMYAASTKEAWEDAIARAERVVADAGPMAPATPEPKTVNQERALAAKLKRAGLVAPKPRGRPRKLATLPG